MAWLVVLGLVHTAAALVVSPVSAVGGGLTGTLTALDASHYDMGTLTYKNPDFGIGPSSGAGLGRRLGDGFVVFVVVFVAERPDAVPEALVVFVVAVLVVAVLVVAVLVAVVIGVLVLVVSVRRVLLESFPVKSGRSDHLQPAGREVAVQQQHGIRDE